MMDQRNIAIAAVVVLVAAIVGYYYFTTETPAPKKEGTSQNQYYALPTPVKYASIDRART